jgi:hypothetical protein
VGRVLAGMLMAVLVVLEVVVTAVMRYLHLTELVEVELLTKDMPVAMEI